MGCTLLAATVAIPSSGIRSCLTLSPWRRMREVLLSQQMKGKHQGLEDIHTQTKGHTPALDVCFLRNHL